jgi:uncharacterized protein involved in cysteine biosynthesis
VTYGSGMPIRPGRRALVIELLEGFVALPQALGRLFFDRAFIGKLKLPVVIGAIVFVFVFASLFAGSYFLADHLLGLPGVLAFVAGAGAFLVALFITWLLAPVLGELVASPFFDDLAETTERMHTRRPMPAVELGFVAAVRTGARNAAKLLLIQIGLLLPILLLALTGVGAAIAAVISAWACALAWFDIPCARRGYSFRERLTLLWHNRMRAIGFGLAFQIGVLLPVVNLVLLLPAAAVAVSHLFFRCEKDSLGTRDDASRAAP